jgi:hypothetical protein
MNRLFNTLPFSGCGPSAPPKGRNYIAAQCQEKEQIGTEFVPVDSLPLIRFLLILQLEKFNTQELRAGSTWH